jgi:hypothetical protein
LSTYCPTAAPATDQPGTHSSIRGCGGNTGKDTSDARVKHACVTANQAWLAAAGKSFHHFIPSAQPAKSRSEWQQNGNNASSGLPTAQNDILPPPKTVCRGHQLITLPRMLQPKLKQVHRDCHFSPATLFTRPQTTGLCPCCTTHHVHAHKPGCAYRRTTPRTEPFC